MQKRKNKKEYKLKNKGLKDSNNFLKYSNIAVQMAVIIVSFSLGGLYLDKYLELKFPVFTLLLTLSSVIISVYRVIKEIINLNK